MNKDNAGVIAHINVLQGIINRMADNSKSCKQWCILVVSAILTLSTKDVDIQTRLFAICLIPLVMFCLLQKIGDGSDDPLLEKRPFSRRETLKRWKREDVNYGS